MTNKVAPGMEICFQITFTPEHRREYNCDLLVLTEREKFIIPIRALGSKGMCRLSSPILIPNAHEHGLTAELAFIDNAVFANVPTNFTSSQAFLLRNIGKKPTDFSAEVNPPFSIEPKDGFLGPDEHAQLLLKFHPKDEEDYASDILIRYNKGSQSVHANVKGYAADVDVSLDADAVALPSAYINLKTHCTVRLFNDSDIPV